MYNTFSNESVVSRINNGEMGLLNAPDEFLKMLDLAAEARKDTEGYFEIFKDGKILPLGLVKGMAIFHIAKILEKSNFFNYIVNIGGDIQTGGLDEMNKKWEIEILNAFVRSKAANSALLKSTPEDVNKLDAETDVPVTEAGTEERLSVNSSYEKS